MAEDAQYASSTDTTTMKRKYEEQTTPSPVQPQSSGRRTTGFSAPITSSSPDSGHTPSSYNSVPPPADDIQLAKQRAQEIAARLFNNASSIEAKRPRVENGGGGGGGFDLSDKGYSSIPSDSGQKPMISSATSQIPVSYGYHQGSNKKIEIPNGRVGVIIGKAGETIKYLQLQSGAKIQVTRDADADPNSPNRIVELMGTPEAIAKAEQLISDVLSEAETGGSGIVSRRVPGPSGSADQFVMQIPNNKVGLVIGKGGETIKNMQARTGARIQVIPLHLPPGDTSIERTLQIDGTSEQIESAKLLVNEVISENRARNSSMGGGYSQQGYQARPPTNWSQPGPPAQQYGYVQPGAYTGPSPQYQQQSYGGYPPQPNSGGYPSNWDQTTAPPSQQTTQGSGYDYYNQQPGAQQQQSQGGPASTDGTGYNYNQQQPASGYNQQGQGYTQDGYSTGYHAPVQQPGYNQPQPQGYDQQGYSAAPAYGNVTNPTPEGHTPSYGAQGDTAQAPPPVQPSATGQQGYAGQQPSPNPAGYPSQPGYGVPPTSQTGYGTQQTVQSGYGPGYGPPQAQKPPAGQPVYGQTQQSPSAQGAYAQPSPVQPGYPQSGYAQPDSAAQRAPSSLGTAAAQPGYAPPPYSAQGYGQQQPPPYNSSYGSGYAQPPAYAADASAGGTTQSGVPKASPQS